jgi:signal transduction histidine kinase
MPIEWYDDYIMIIGRRKYSYTTTPKNQRTIEALWRLQKVILDTLDFKVVSQKITDSLLDELGYLKLGYRIIVLTLLDEEAGVLRRISLSQTNEAQKAQKASAIPFHEIGIPLSANDNLLIRTLKDKKPYTTHHWPDIFRPILTDDQALANQQAAGIKTSMLLPIVVKDKSIGVLIFSLIKSVKEVGSAERDLIRGFSDIVGLAVQNASLYSQLESKSAELKKANRNLRHLDKLKDEFVYIATHELKNPVTAMRGYLSLINEGLYGEVPKKLKDPLTQLNASNQQLVTLVNDLLQIARSEAKSITIHTETVDVCSIIEAVLGSLKPLADQKKLKLTHHCLTKQLLVKADPDKLREIFNNLVSNAIKYSENGSISVYHIIEQGMVVTHVKDQGYGIAEKDQKKLFTRFYRVEEQVAKGIPGTGLGLFIVKQLIEKMGGRIWFTSKQGVGTTFSFSLPQG